MAHLAQAHQVVGAQEAAQVEQQSVTQRQQLRVLSKKKRDEKAVIRQSLDSGV